MFQIEQNIPIPTVVRRRQRASKYPLREMAVGDSFLIPVTDGDTESDEAFKLQRNITSMAARWKVKVSCRRMEGGVRVWRTA